jgi:hypothetical protein
LSSCRVVVLSLDDDSDDEAPPLDGRDEACWPDGGLCALDAPPPPMALTIGFTIREISDGFDLSGFDSGRVCCGAAVAVSRAGGGSSTVIGGGADAFGLRAGNASMSVIVSGAGGAAGSVSPAASRPASVRCRGCGAFSYDWTRRYNATQNAIVSAVKKAGRN